ncbi:MAG TPA: LacI family DNA-binding transcriptional regulator [Streptosporangiaceae bacterium]
MRKTTLAAIAAMAGVSPATVSKVVNGRPDVAPGTRARVERLLAEHGYARPRPQHRRAGLIDLVHADRPWAVEIMRGVADWSAAHETAIAVCPETGVDASCAGPRSARPESWTSAMASHGSRGVILVTFSGLTGDQLSQLRRAAIPVVVIDAANAPPAGLPGVGATNWAGGLAATEHLLGLGHRRIAAITGPADLLCSRARVGGYRSALDRAGIGFDPALLRYGDFHYAGGYLRAAELLDLPEPPTAIFAGCDEQAFGVLEAARTRGLRVPQDLSLVGFDGLPVTGWSSPPITTVRQPLAEMGSVAAQMLADLIGGNAPAPGRVELPTELIVRESTAPPASTVR